MSLRANPRGAKRLLDVISLAVGLGDPSMAREKRVQEVRKELADPSRVVARVVRLLYDPLPRARLEVIRAFRPRCLAARQRQASHAAPRAVCEGPVPFLLQLLPFFLSC